MHNESKNPLWNDPRAKNNTSVKNLANNYGSGVDSNISLPVGFSTNRLPTLKKVRLRHLNQSMDVSNLASKNSSSVITNKNSKFTELLNDFADEFTHLSNMSKKIKPKEEGSA